MVYPSIIEGLPAIKPASRVPDACAIDARRTLFEPGRGCSFRAAAPDCVRHMNFHKKHLPSHSFTVPIKTTFTTFHYVGVPTTLAG
jgi:hypothetical protein